MSKSTSSRRDLLARAAMRGCTIAVFLLLFFFIFTQLAADFTPAIDLKTFLVFLAFSQVISYAQFIFSAEAIPPVARLIVHFFLLAFAFFLVLLATTRTFLVGYILYALTYALALLLSLIHRRRSRKTPPPKKADEPYTSRFS